MKNNTQVKMRALFAQCIHEEMSKNKDIWVIVNDLGYKMWDRIRKDFPQRFINVGAAEQSLIGVAVGLALEGKTPVVYSITSFLLYRPFETIRNYVNYEKIPLKLIGAGRDKDYLEDGFSHWAEEDKDVIKLFRNIKSDWPVSNEEISDLVKKMLRDKNPWYINLRR